LEARANRNLAARLHALYVGGAPDALDLLAGTQTLDDLVDGLDGIERTVAHDRALAGAARAARAEARSHLRMLARREAELLALLEAERAALEAERAAVAARTRSLQSRPATRDRMPARRVFRTAAPVRAPVLRALTVVATGYALRGRTASGMPTGHGVAAVDPAVIPLGTRMSVPGYGTAVAADVGSAIRGARIDLWFPSVAAARAWGSRTVTITLG